MNEFVEPFLEEARELVEQASDDLLALEHAPGDRERLDSAFRAFHTLKGAAGIVEFAAMARACHAVEDALATVRDAGGRLERETVSAALACLGQIDSWLDAMTDTGEPPADADPDAEAIVRLFAPADQPAPAPVGADGLAGLARRIVTEQIALLSMPAPEGMAGRIASAGRSALAALDRITPPVDGRAVATAMAASLAAVDPRPLAAALAGALAPPASDPEAGGGPRDAARGSLRVPVERVDALVRLAGELTVAKNALGHVADLARAGAGVPQIEAALREGLGVMDGLVRELQRAALAIRVLPLRVVFQRFPRLVHEIAGSLGKDVRFDVAGEETEADKAVVEGLFEPLLHVLRNAVDHGVEAPADRRAAGKPPAASIALTARREGETVLVEVEDDGRGIDVARVRAAAVASGAATAGAVAAMSDAEAMTLIFAPGLSTADAVSAVSGRGVGMDAVRAAVERIGGTVSVESAPGRGTRVRFSLPFAVMMTAVMTVAAGGQRYGVPLDAIVETVRLPRAAVLPVGAARAFVLRDRTIPLVDLAAALAGGAAPVHPERGPDATILVAWADGRPTGFEVDRLGERLDVMLKPLDGLLAGMPAVAGTTVTGDGSVLLVLDLAELVRSQDG